MRISLAALFAAHGIAHLVGFVGALNLTPDIHFTPTMLGGAVVLGERGLRLYGAAWLLGALSYIVVALLVAVGSPRWRWAGLVVTVGSLLLCILGWPVSQVGIYVDLALLALMLGGRRQLNAGLRV